MNFRRLSGILLHPTSFPGTPGIGTIGKPAYEFADWLETAGQRLWQILPLGPTGYGDSPYASFSTFAGNPLLIDLDMLAENGWTEKAAIIPPDFIKSDGPVDYGAVVYWKNPVLKKSAGWFLAHCSERDRVSYEAFKNDAASWLDKYAVFMSIKQVYDAEAQKKGVSGMWNEFWPQELASCNPAAVSLWESNHTREIEAIKVIQFFFFSQWKRLKTYVNAKGISIIGDIPIFVAPDSADVWANQHLFQLDKRGVPLNVAGVPPDYFSATGQLWGNPLYDWAEMKKNGYFWWIERIRQVLSLVDYVRIDHFRGFEAYWSVPYGDRTAENGTWVPGPNTELFTAIKKSLGDIPVIAEDLGLITKEVRELRESCGFPGMKVLQFAFDEGESGKEGMTNAFLPHMYEKNCVVYTGTHDNETMQGWLENAPDRQVQIAAEYVSGTELTEKAARTLADSGKLCRMLVTAAIASTGNFAVIPLQDIYAVNNTGRMNMPSTTGTNWTWRMAPDMLTTEKAGWLSLLSHLYGRNGPLRK
jgi:4-alpha-glucanotransferase